MPYIPQDRRTWLRYNGLDPKNNAAYFSTETPGELNYYISGLIWELFDRNPSYTRANDLLGVLDAVAREFYRRKVVPYENKKMKEHGDV